MNEGSVVVALLDFMDTPRAWGRIEGRAVYQRLLGFVEDHPGVTVFKVSMRGVERMDMSFASETVLELARRFRGSKGFCVVDLTDSDLIENLHAAAVKKEQPLLVWQGKSAKVIGTEPSEGNREALQFALDRPRTR